jgi:hypothetical protein
MLAGSTLIYRKLSSPPQALRSSTTPAARHKMKKKKKKIGAEFMTSVSYRPEVIIKVPTKEGEISVILAMKSSIMKSEF